METHLADWCRDTPEGKEAEAILRACVHCGFCTATCPTYQELGDELDGPRGRIYLIKQLLEGRETSERTQLHLDRCLSCRACETTCPSGVKYHRLADIGRQVLSERQPRPLGQRLMRGLLAESLTRPAVFGTALRLGQALRPLLPSALADKVPARDPGLPPAPAPAATPGRRVLLLAGCVQPSLAPSINQAARRVLAALGIGAIEAPKAGCCGAVRFHLDQQGAARDDMRRLIDHWWPFIANGTVEAILVTASGCGAQLKDYGLLLKDDPDYAAKAARVSELCRDLGDFLGDQIDALLDRLPPTGQPTDATGQSTAAASSRPAPTRVAVHTPCTLQHALKRRGDIERLLGAAGYQTTPVAEAHLCCGSAGTYSLLQPELARRLRDRKLDALIGGGPAAHAAGQAAAAPEVIATANIGCLNHLQSGTALPVRHWIELLAARLG